ncbi:MAG: hypothetical protein HYU41_11160 [Candidatus Rokubacteria bacterium]|nr:hypothetical protein [Candidatus Rokubacteria bacterium]
MTAAWDEEWEAWPRVALLSFWLRFPAELGQFGKTSEARKAERDRFLRYGLELEATERDLSECVNELSLACETLYEGNLTLKKFAVVYHTDNFNVRLHKISENAHTLVALTVGLNPGARGPVGGIPLKEQLRRALSKRRILGLSEVMTEFENSDIIRNAIEARHAFVHRYRDEPARGFGARDRYAWLPEPKDDPLAEAVRLLSETGIDLYGKQRAEGLAAAIEPVRTLRRRLFTVAAREVLRLGTGSLAPDRMEELKTYIDPFV